MEARPGGVGPDGQCTSAAWSPDGKWMYFSSDSSGSFHIWRQRFPEGAPEQITDGPTEEAGIPPDPDGRSLLTSVGSRHSSIWIHDERGEREISREGYAFIPKTPNGGTSQPLSADGRSVYYLVRQGAVRFGGVGERVGELWAADVATGASKPIVTGRNVIGYDSSHDGTQLAFAALDDRGVAHVWLMRLDRANEPWQISTLEMDSPRFNRAGDVFCRGRENGQTFVYRLRPGGAPEKLLNSSAETLIMPLGPGGAMPAFPAEGFQSKADLAGLSVAHATNGWGYPIGTGSTYVFARASTQRNIYRIALR
jgi:dipeptidyl aminopeptidase/acylaminoacyl peptidase